MRNTILLTMFIALLIAAQPCLGQFEMAYDINIGDEAPYIAIDDSGYVYATYRKDWAIVVAKLDSLGDTLWTRTHCNGVACNPHDIALDANANVYVVGPADQLFNDTAMGDCNLDLLSYDSAGNFRWAVSYPYASKDHYPDGASISGALRVTPDGQVRMLVTRKDYYVDNTGRERAFNNSVLLGYDVTGAEIINTLFECPIEWRGIPGRDVFGKHDLRADGSVSIAMSTYADIEVCPPSIPGNEPDTAYQWALWLYGANLAGNSTYEDHHYRDNMLWEPCVANADGTAPVTVYSTVYDVSADGFGNTNIFGYLNFPQYGNAVQHSFVAKFDPDWNLLWSTPVSPWQSIPQGDMVCNSAGEIAVASFNAYPYYRLWRIDPDGNAISTQWPCRKVAIDEAGNTYAAYSDLRKYDADLNPIWTQWLWNTYLNEIEVDRDGSVFLAGEGDWGGYLVKLRQVATLVIRDAHGDTIPNVEFELIRVSNDPPQYTEDTLGYFTTDSLGQFKLPMVRCDSLLFPVGAGNDRPDTLAIGDTIKVAKHLASQPSFKNPNVSSYSVHLDNARFDKEGVLLLDTVALDIFDITLGHTEVRFNLSVTTEWRATFGYMAELQDNIRLMSNYLYDVSDGQIRLDTVTTYAAGNWALSDVRIFASNVLRPNADVNGMFGPDLRRYVNFPRKFIPGRSDRRNLSDVTPLLLTDVSDDYRAKAHELGHYALGFYDEYEFLTDTGFVADDALRCFAFPLSNYGFMDSQYESDGEKSSEMSSAYRYELAPCQNTEQWGLNGMSCWDQFEDSYEGIWGADHIYAPILVPKVDDEEEHDSLTATYIFPGPNDDINNLDYDVGRLVVFPLSPQTQQLDYKNVHVAVEGIFNPAEVIVELVNKPLQPYEKKIDQGETSDAGRIWVLGAYEPSYSIHASRGRVDELFARTASSESVTEKWLYATAEPGAGLDSVTLTMEEVAGDYPLICQATLQADQLVYELVVEQPFSSVPSVRLYPGYDSSFSYDLVAGTSGYSVAITDSLGSLGSIDTWAVDDSASQFFFPTCYTIANVTYSNPVIEILGPADESRFVIDTSNVGIDRAIVLSSPYPVIRTGLEPSAVQAGKTHCLSLVPAQELHSSNLVIGYADGDLMVGDLKKGDESTLEVYRWMDGTQGWSPVGGSTVDTVRNQVWSPLPSPGTYAAFTTSIITDVDDDEHGVILPYQFELSQNYPNPFNPITTIEYSLPRRDHVIIEVYNLLGQKVQTLVDREESAGSYTTTWDGTTADGQTVATGVYLYRLQVGDHVETKKMLLLK